MTPNEIISSGLLELYVLGMTNEQETAQVLAMSKQYPEVASEISSIEMTLEHYARVHSVIPAMKLKEKVFVAISEGHTNKTTTSTIGKHEAKVVHVSSSWKYVAAAAVLLLIGSIILNYNYYSKYETVQGQLIASNNSKDSLQQQLALQQQSNSDMKNDLGIVQSKFSEPHALNGLPDAPDAKAKIFWMKNTGDVYIDPSNLPDAPQGMQYQFWGIVDGKPVDGGLIIITKKEDKYRIQKMKSFGKAEAFAVTLETMGGHPQPQGKMYVMGKM